MTPFCEDPLPAPGSTAASSELSLLPSAGHLLTAPPALARWPPVPARALPADRAVRATLRRSVEVSVDAPDAALPLRASVDVSLFSTVI